MSLKLYIYCIHTKSLINRATKINSIVELFKNTTLTHDNDNNFEVIINYILKPDVADLYPNIEKLQSKINKTPTNIQIFDNHLSENFNIQMISNIEKHREAWKSISNSNDTSNSYHLIIEDDVFLIPTSMNNFKDLLSYIKKESTPTPKWDMLFLGFPIKDNNDPFDIVKINNINDILPSKESYFISQNSAKLLYNHFDNYKFTLKTELSYLMHTNKLNINSYYTNKRITVDGSKVGVFSSSIHETNPLIYNNEYMGLYSFFIKDKNEIIENFNNIENIFKITENLKNPDICLIYAKILIKIDKFKEAKDILLSSIEYSKQFQSILNNRSEIVNILIDISSKTQDDLDTIISNKSKFENYTMSD
jgi:GR25 family glycosyltransferase involved in LPS biosynthesis